MKPEIKVILDKLNHLRYLVQHKKNVQVILLAVKEGQLLTQTERNQLVIYVQSKLSADTQVRDFDPDKIDMHIYIAVPDGESLEPLKALRGDFQKTP